MKRKEKKEMKVDSFMKIEGSILGYGAENEMK